MTENEINRTNEYATSSRNITDRLMYFIEIIRLLAIEFRRYHRGPNISDK